MDWADVLKNPPDDLELIHELGLPQDPSSIYGCERLTVRMDGSLRLQWWQGPMAGEWRARVPARLARRWVGALSRAGFPAFPQRPLVPGASYRLFEAHLGAEQVRALLSRFHFEETPPYDAVCELADSLVAQIRGRPCWADPDPARGAVQDIVRVEPPTSPKP